MKPVTTQNIISGNAGAASRGGALLKAAKILTAAFVLLSAFIWKIPAAARTCSYWTVREILKVYTVAGAVTWKIDIGAFYMLNSGPQIVTMRRWFWKRRSIFTAR